MFDTTPGPYTGPIPIITHLHGSHSDEESDGFAEAWYLPNAADIPAGYFPTGSFHSEFKTKAESLYGQPWDPGAAVFQYPNDQLASTLWYHDHTLGITRVNVYAGPAGYYILRGGSADLPAGVLPAGVYEIPILIQDRSFIPTGRYSTRIRASSSMGSPARTYRAATLLRSGTRRPSPMLLW